jgi:hypothetical protein
MVVSLSVVAGYGGEPVVGSAPGCSDPAPQATRISTSMATTALVRIVIVINDRTRVE